MSFCIECGAQLKRNAVSCAECGRPVEDDVVSADEDVLEPDGAPPRPRAARRKSTRPQASLAKSKSGNARARRPRPVPADEPAFDETQLVHRRKLAALPPEPPLDDLPPVPAIAPADRDVEGPGTVAARVAGIFAVVGLGLAVASLLFLWESGFFDVGADPASFEDFAEDVIGVFALAAVAVFAVPLGATVAALGGIFAAARSAKMSDAVRAGTVGAAAGYLALALILSGSAVLAIEVRSGLDSAEPSPTPTTAPRSQAQESCEEIFGEGSPSCQNFGAGDLNVQGDVDVFGDVEDTDGWTNDIARLGLGIIPSALVGALSAAVAFRRKR